MGFAAKIQTEKAKVYCLQYDRSTPDAAYFFLEVNPLKDMLFQRALKTGADQKLESFGTVIASGWGEPGAGVRERMGKLYNLEFLDA